ncbi:rCG57715, partial [Rattus norvegicus]
MNPFFPSCSPRFLAEACALCSLLCGQASCLTLHSLLGKVGKRQDEDLLFYSFPNKRTCQLEAP